MSSGIARHRAGKAARRKKVLAERRKLAQAEAGLPLAERARRLATAPVHCCLIQEELFERGNGMVILARKTGSGRLAMASFLVDVWCLGVKDVIFRQLDVSEMEDFVAVAGAAAPFVSVDPSYARKLLRDVVAWARSLGLPPHADYAAAELLFGDSAAAACDAAFSFGHDGKPLYIPGPDETPAQVRRRLEGLRRQLGDDGFDFMAAVPMDENEDDFAEDALGYDPDIAPDPVPWLALDEDERINLVAEYHRRAGIALPDDVLHAVFHAIVETQIALGDEAPVRRTVERLIDEGLDRHEAVHAVGTALAEHLHDVMQTGTAKPISNEAYFAAVERLTAESWRREYGSDDEAEDADDPDGP
jgi:hypothetical protein